MKTFNRLIIATAFAVAVAAPAAAKDPLAAMMAGESAMQGKKLKKAIEKASEHPFGSAQNPVRAHFPPGQRSYLARLRCEDGNAPSFSRGGSVGASPYNNVMDVYIVDCGESAPGKMQIYMDMYHKGHVEKEPVPGFSIRPS